MLVYLLDVGCVFFLGGKNVESQTLEDPMSLELQLHQLLLRHGVTPVALASQPCLGEVYRRQLHVGLPEIADGWRLRP